MIGFAAVTGQAADLIRRRPYVASVILAVTLVLWVLSGEGRQKGSAEELGEQAGQSVVIPTVRVQTQHARPIAREVHVVGTVEPDIDADIAAERDGTVIAVHAARGTMVQKDDLLIELSRADLDARIQRARALVKKRVLEHEGATSLGQGQFRSRLEIAEAEVNLAAARAELAALEVEDAHTLVRAPFAGFLEDRYVEVGAYVASGDIVATLIATKTMVVRGAVSATDVQLIKENQSGRAELPDGQVLHGHVHYISAVPDAGTRTYDVELVVVRQTAERFTSGLAADLYLPVGEVEAHVIPPSLLTLDDQGRLGIKTVTNENTVVFHPVEIVRSELEKLWLTGLPDPANIIVLGQGYTRAGEVVRVAAEPLADNTPPQTGS